MKGSDILKIRENLGLTQQQLAEQLDVAMKTVSRWENGETKKIPEAVQEQLLKLAERGKALIYTNEAKLFLQLQRIRRGSISPWLLLPHITTASIAACDAFVDRGVKIIYSDNLNTEETVKLADLPNIAEQGPIVLLGSAGSGKTFFLRWIADSQGIDAERDVWHRLGNKIPVIYPLIEYSVPPKNKDIVLQLGHPLLAAIAEYHNFSGTKLDLSLFLNACKRGEVLFLFDALDEISNEASRQDVIKELETLMLTHDNCAFILTSRHEKYGNPKHSFLTQIQNQTICELSPLTFDEQHDLIRNLYHSLARKTASVNNQIQQTIEIEQFEENVNRCIDFIRTFPYKDAQRSEFLRNPLHLVLVALLILEGYPPSTTDVQLEHQCLELNIIRWPEARSIGQSVQTSINFPGTSISKNQIWSKLSKWALELVENEAPLDTTEIERWIMDMPVEPEGETKHTYAKRITTLMLERLPFILHLQAKGKFSINQPHLTHLAAHRLTEMRNRMSLASWLFNNDNYKDWKRVEVWKRAILITSIIHRQPDIVNYDLEEFVETYSPDELDSMFDTADSMGLIIKDLLERTGVLDWEARKNFYRFLMEIFMITDYDETAKFFFRIFQSIQTPPGQNIQENEEQKQNCKLLKEVCNELTKPDHAINYDKIWREYALRYAIGEYSGEDTEWKLLQLLKKLEKQSLSLKPQSLEWKELEISKRRTIFVFLLMQLEFTNKMPKHLLSNATISTLINIIDNKDKYEVGVVGRACDVLDKVKTDKHLNPKIQSKLREIFQKIDSSITSLKVVATYENALVVSMHPELLVNQVEEEVKNQEFQVYTSETVKRLKNFFSEVQRYYAEVGEGLDIELSKILFNRAIDRTRTPLLRAVSFLYLSELPSEIEAHIPNLLSHLEACFKTKPRPEEDNASVGAVQIYDYNQACLNRHYSRRSQKNNSSSILNLKAIQDISYTS
jgi:transcriptional regulator with XRE-family HTH domain